MLETRLFVKCVLPLLFMCCFTVAAAGTAFSQPGLATDASHSQPAPSAAVPVNIDDAKPEAGTAHQIGDRMADGTIYVGISPEVGKAMYTTAADGPLTYTFNQAKEYCSKLDAYGYRDWRVPTKGELNVLFKNRDAISGFNETGSYPAGWYWSSSQDINVGAWGQRFSDGGQNHDYKDYASSLRCVR